jgi:hypothetical protein
MDLLACARWGARLYAIAAPLERSRRPNRGRSLVDVAEPGDRVVERRLR